MTLSSPKHIKNNSTLSSRICLHFLSLSFFLLFLLGCNSLEPSHNSDEKGNSLFTLLDSEITGIDFSNDIVENLENGMNVLDYDYFYNGSGVAVEDLDNDGLLDLIFTANQGQNKIYKNLGGLKFEDLTENSGINANKNWSSGVTTVDINDDGLQDIFICQGGPFPKEKRHNLLYVNKGNFKFEEKAADYGLADSAISTQAVFFDMENDGDLDCLVLNETPLFGFAPTEFYKFLDQQKNTLLHPSTCHLYENVDEKFTEVTLSAGLSTPAFSLGVSVADLNGDGFQDFYIANDYFIPDVLYINNQDGTFKDNTKEKMNQVSFYGMGVDIEDINNDGHQDIMVLDMATADHYRAKTLMASMDVESFELLTETFGFPYQYMFNTLQLNTGQGHFNNIAAMSGLGKTDWSWAPLIADYDLDYEKEIYVTNGYNRYSKDNDFQKKVNDLKTQHNGDVPLAAKKKLYSEIPSEKLSNQFYQKKSSLSFAEKTKEAGLELATFSNGAAYGDLDNDGDLELIVNNIDDTALLYKNNTRENSQSSFLKIKLPQRLLHSKVTVFQGDISQSSQAKKVKGYLSSVSPQIIFGTSETIVDSVVIEHHSGTLVSYQPQQNATLSMQDFQSTNSPKQDSNPNKFKKVQLGLGAQVDNNYNDFEKEILLPYKQSTLGPNIILSNNDNQKLFVSGSVGQASQVCTINNGALTCKALKGKMTEDSSAIFFDFDSDGDEDLYVITGGNSLDKNSNSYKDKFYVNEGGNYILRTDLIEHNKNYSGNRGIALDLDKDGVEEILIANRIIPQQYPTHAPMQLLKVVDGRLVDVIDDFGPELKNFGIVNDLLLIDIDKDDRNELVVAGEWTGIGVYEINETIKKSDNYSELEELKGWWFSLTECDINSDGLSELIAGNLGLNSKYKASKKKPMKVLGNDFDKNGTYDIVLSNKYKEDEVPLRGLECSSDQMPFIGDKFKSYADFANANIADIYGKNEVAAAYTREVNEFKSVHIDFTSNQVSINALPDEAQLRPILDGIHYDVNDDGYEDLILVGNLYNTEVETPRLDYKSATVLLSDGDQLRFSAEYSNQLTVNKNSKSINVISFSDKEIILIGNNNDDFDTFLIKE